MTNNVDFGLAARKKLLDGINKIANAIAVTIGAKGRTVIIERPFYSPQITKDGVTVARSINLPDPIENMGAALIKEVASKTVDLAGDGTSSSAVLTQAIITRGLKAVESGANPMDLKRGIDKATSAVVKYIQSVSTEVKDDDSLKNIASISANNDSYIGGLIADAVAQVGRDGQIKVEEGKGHETTITVESGMKLDRGYISHFFINNKEKKECVLQNPVVLIYDKKIGAMKDYFHILNKAAETGRAVFVICEDLEGEALAGAIHNNLQGHIKFCAIKAPEWGDNQKEVLEDIAVLTETTVISESKGQKLEQALWAMLGGAESITVTKDSCLIVGGIGKIDVIESRCNEIKTDLDNATAVYDINNLKSRLAKLKNGVAVLSIGGVTETEIREKKDRIDDALCATRSAVEEGYVAGGGVTLLSAAKDLVVLTENEDEKAGVAILKSALEVPFRQILENGGIEASAYIKEIQNAEYGIGYNIKTNVVENLLESGVIDPTKVVRVALENAASIAGMFLTTEAIVSLIKEDNACSPYLTK